MSTEVSVAKDLSVTSRRGDVAIAYLPSKCATGSPSLISAQGRL